MLESGNPAIFTSGVSPMGPGLGVWGRPTDTSCLVPPADRGLADLEAGAE